MATKRRGLGKGLDILIPQTEEETKVEQIIENALIYVDIDKVEPNRNQPRKNFDEDSLNELAESIKQNGVFQPLLVQKKDDYYEIIAGERRWRASKLAGLKEIPVIVKDFNSEEVMVISLLENIQREDLDPIEEAMGYKRLIDEFKMKQDEVAERMSKNRSTITNSLRLLKLDPKIQQMVISKMISAGHARAILGLPENVDKVLFAERVFDENMSVRDVEREIKKLQSDKKEDDKKKKRDEQYDAVLGELEERLKSHLGTKVKISSKDGEKGSVEIEFYSKAQLSELFDKLISV